MGHTWCHMQWICTTEWKYICLNQGWVIRTDISVPLHCFPVQVEYSHPRGFINNHTIGLCCNRPGERLSHIKLSRWNSGLWRRVDSRKLPGRSQCELHSDICKAWRWVEVDHRFSANPSHMLDQLWSKQDGISRDNGIIRKELLVVQVWIPKNEAAVRRWVACFRVNELVESGNFLLK